jgi:hypothetical protein
VILTLNIWNTSAATKRSHQRALGAVDCNIFGVNARILIHHCHCLLSITTPTPVKMKFSLSVIVASLGAASAFAFNSGSSHATIAKQSFSFRRAALAQPAFKNHFQTDDSSTALAATAAAANSDAIKTRGGGALGGIDIRKCRISCKNVLYHVMCESHFLCPIYSLDDVLSLLVCG